ncbi:hypothetical protein [Tardiphaga sp. 285_C5_N1_2]|uniref:hypothetical protein n=1 Tax=Tardiphaga sp. 285_C5_N1_2 TaxID=3240775 RepID=UPI003F8A5200
MSETPFDIRSIAHEINAQANSYAIGALQKMRKELRGLSRRPGSDIFSDQTIHPHWAFHRGGRSELQFNIGLEDHRGEQELRHGVAFSFELSQALPSIDVLVPKARLFGEYLQLCPDLYADMRMWDYRDGEPSGDYPPGPVVPELVRPGCFVFLGKRQPIGAIDYNVILADFDRLLPLYSFVESGGHELRGAQPGNGFVFQAGCTEKASATKASLVERELNINLRHTLLQAALCDRLIKQYGAENVADEHASGLGSKIDVVLRRSAKEFWYYEIKTALSPRACIREALGQVMEYAYWPHANEAARLVICGETALDDDGATYLETLQQRFRLPVAYEQIDIA